MIKKIRLYKKRYLLYKVRKRFKKKWGFDDRDLPESLIKKLEVYLGINNSV